ncbi:MAG: tetratricopeptide repeat protein [Thermotogae bacterium]|nr:tetratricopeptide repeat protein [Thermotogota bacterium]
MTEEKKDYIALVYLSIKPDIAKRYNLPLKLPVRAEDMPRVIDEDKIPLDIIIRGLESQLKITPKDEYYRSYLVSAYLEKVKEAIRDRSPEASRVYLEKAREAFGSEDHRYYFFKGMIEKMQGDLISAEKALRISLQMAPSDLLINFELANLLLENGEYEDALNHYKVCMEIEPGFSLSYLKAGDVYVSMKRFDKAEKMYRRAHDLDTKMVEPYIRLGVENNIQQRFKQAIRWFESGMRVKKDEWSLYYNASHAYDRLGVVDKAIRALKYAIEELHVDLPFMYNELGLIYQKVGLNETALEMFLRGLDSTPNEATLLLNTANLYRSLNMVSIAKEYYLRLVGLADREKIVSSIYDMYEEQFDVDNLVLSLGGIELSPDTEVYLYEAQHIKQNYEEYVKEYMKKLSSHLVHALNSAPGIRRAMMEVMQSLRQDYQIDFLKLDSLVKDSKGLKGWKDWFDHPDNELSVDVMERTIAISIFYHRDPYVLKRLITGSTLLTHRNMRALAANIGFGLLIREMLLYGNEAINDFKYDFIKEVSEFCWELGRKGSDVDKTSFEEKINSLARKPNVDTLFLASFDICLHPERDDEEYIEIISEKSDELDEVSRDVLYFTTGLRNPEPDEGLNANDIILETFKRIYNLK